MFGTYLGCGCDINLNDLIDVYVVLSFSVFLVVVFVVLKVEGGIEIR